MKLMKSFGIIAFAGTVGLGLANNGYSDDEAIIKYRTHDGERKEARVFRQNGDPHIDFERARGGTAIKQIYERGEYAVEGAIKILKDYGDYCELEDVVMIEDKTGEDDLVRDVLKAKHKRFSSTDDEDKHELIEDLFDKDEYPDYSTNKEDYLKSGDKDKYEEDREVYTIKKRRHDSLKSVIDLLEDLF